MTDKPIIIFPCDYPIKVIGKSHAHFDAEVIAAINPHLKKPYDGVIQQKDSNKQNFVSLTLTIQAESEEQIKDIFEALKTVAGVIMVL
jgi:putative lipoic acid-binding regulatory protein